MQATMKENETKHLSFRLGDETFAVPILTVREIIGRLEVTALPDAASHLKGVINLRGKIVPVLDLRARFGMPEGERRRENCIITLMADLGSGPLLIGMQVDAVSEVLQLGEGSVEPLPALQGRQALAWVRGLAKTPGGVTILLDVERLLTAAELPSLDDLAPSLGVAAA
jgi:purine-binding chemotaxis protein CheW